ncbi:MAG TPA: hypothetical protein GX740_02105 [Acholeplasmataceae bacterium]|jgi:hypothetical protein|nr:hypothetical protein [Acholeplasmataceae bacterium]
MNLEKFGKTFYIGSLVATIIIFVAGSAIIKNIPNLAEETAIRYWNFTQYIVFGVVIPIGVIVREFILLAHVKKFMFFKLFIYSIQLVALPILFFVIPTVTMSRVILYLSYGVVILAIIPTQVFKKLE